MKKIIVMLALGVMVAGGSYAQDAPQAGKKNKTEHRAHKGRKQASKAPEERAKMRTERMAQKYELNKSQQNKLEALHLKQASEREAMRANRQQASADREATKEAMKANHAQYQAELKKILNNKQYAQYKADRKEMQDRFEKREQGKENRGRNGAKSSHRS
ncbi:DUF4890 domain-containing protein [Pontibacter sp. 13R65]|uniref:DUF4890 domain-containing protein n=1 Tax=Pontibacter sp. 13R65 TaxID=3127458 RepID=UPI00301CF309